MKALDAYFSTQEIVASDRIVWSLSVAIKDAESTTRIDHLDIVPFIAGHKAGAGLDTIFPSQDDSLLCRVPLVDIRRTNQRALLMLTPQAGGSFFDTNMGGGIDTISV